MSDVRRLRSSVVVIGSKRNSKDVAEKILTLHLAHQHEVRVDPRGSILEPCRGARHGDASADQDCGVVIDDHRRFAALGREYLSLRLQRSAVVDQTTADYRAQDLSA